VTRLPDYYFRVRENGAQVFRVDTENRLRRIEMDPIATVNVKNGEIKPQGDRVLSQTDRSEIERWLADRRAVLAGRQLDDVQRLLDQLNLITGWAQQRATPADLATVSDDLLLAMHDLRSVLVRKKTDGMGKRDANGDG